ncbi:hypothetical protein OG612_45220 (plasmid) [Streptomyces sp. NBC_01527]|uniref:hypothetical protein n=1 Tax=Streptomyces sp. NBC_01527 TaxID=2903894 RepID=UPI002F916573
MHATPVRPKPKKRTVAALMRAMARPNPRLQCSREYVCEREQCLAAWAGEEADCWNCGMPATDSNDQRGSALQRLLAAVDSHAVRSRSPRKAAQA